MNSQVFEQIRGKKNLPKIELVSSSALNETFHVSGEGYFHFSAQPHLATEEEALLLDRYIYKNKGEKIAQRAISAATVARAMTSARVVVPSVLQYGLMTNPKSGESLSYWVDSEAVGVNAKVGKGILNLEEYKVIIDWIMTAQVEIKEEGHPLNEDYVERNNAFRSLVDSGYYESSVSGNNLAVLDQAADTMMQLNEEVYLDQPPVFKHGDLHIANILRKEGDALAIVDFEASAGGPGDNLKDIMKLLHIDYLFFDVKKSREGAFLTDNERILLLDYYISKSKLDGATKLRESSYLMKRTALDSLTRYAARLTLATLQGDAPVGARTQRLVRDMASVVNEMMA
jgi:hypothetical protein